MPSNAPVGIFDSGVGGISVLAEARKLLPTEHFIYYGDTLHAPYGTKSREEVLNLSEAAFDILRYHGCKAIVIACNTATAAAASYLRQKWSDFPIIAMEPALKPASLLRHGGNVIVLATPMTLRLEKFARLMELYGEGAIPVACPGLPEIVEDLDFSNAEIYLNDILQPYLKQTLDAVVLGCTHYVFLRSILKEILPPVTQIVDGNYGTARQLERVLKQRNLCNNQIESGTCILTSSSQDPEAIDKMKKLLAFAEKNIQ